MGPADCRSREDRDDRDSLLLLRLRLLGLACSGGSRSLVTAGREGVRYNAAGVCGRSVQVGTGRGLHIKVLELRNAFFAAYSDY